MTLAASWLFGFLGVRSSEVGADQAHAIEFRGPAAAAFDAVDRRKNVNTRVPAAWPLPGGRLGPR